MNRVQALMQQLEAALAGLPVLDSPLVSLVGLAALGLFLLIAVMFIVRLGLRLVNAARRASAAAAIRLAKESKLVVLVAEGGGGARRYAQQALDEHFGAFTFDAPVEIRTFPLRLPVPGARDKDSRRRALASAQFWMRQCDADLVIWGKSTGLRGQRRFFAAAPTPDGELPSPVEIDITRNATVEQGRLALGFLAAGVLRPTLSRPYDFKAERLAPLAQKVSLIAPEAFTLFGPKAARRIADDYANAAASLGDRLADRAWLDHALAIAAQALEATDRRTEPATWARIRQTLARAHGVLGEQTRDQKLLAQARDGFRDALDALAGTDSLILAQGAARGLQRADAALEVLRNPPKPQLVPPPQTQPAQPARPAAPANPGQMRSFYGNYAASLI